MATLPDAHESTRLASLAAYAIMDTPAEADFDELAQLASLVCDTPIAMITLLDENRQWAKAQIGIDARDLPRAEAFCSQTLNDSGALVMLDTLSDADLVHLPLVNGPAQVRFYAGAPLVSIEGEILGALCVMDRTSRQLTDAQQAALWSLSRQVMAQMNLRRRIAESAAAQQTLARSEASLAAAQMRAHLGSWELDLVTGVGFWSAEQSRLHYRDADAPAPTLAEFHAMVHADDRARMSTLPSQAQDAHVPSIEEYRTHPDLGAVRWLRSTIETVRDEYGVIVRLEGTTLDITDQRRSETRVRRLIDSNAQGVIFWNAGGRITAANDAFLRIVGYSREELDQGTLDWASMTPPEYADLDRRAIAEMLDRGTCVPFEKEYFRKDGSRVPILLGAALFEDSTDDGVCYVIDLTERKRLEQQFLRAQRMESIGTLAGGIAHDLNNVLGPIMMSLELLALRHTDEESRELLQILSMSAQRGADMVRQVLTFARGAEGSRVEIRVTDLLVEIERIVRETFFKQLDVRFRVSPTLWTVRGDPTQLHQVLLNLCMNARDAMPSGGTLTITAENRELDKQYAAMNTDASPGPHVMLQIEDSGVGIPSDVITRIFDPFFTTKAVGKGTGLGLSTALSIVKGHGGFVQVYSEPGRGTRVVVYVPANTHAPSTPVVPEAVLLPRGNGELVMVVDDETAARQITRQTLEAFGYTVVTAADGAEAIAAFARRGDDIAVVLTDMTMPIMDGIALIQVLRKLKPELPIIAASGLAANGHVAHATRLGVRHFLSKPYTADTLLKLLREVLTVPV